MSLPTLFAPAEKAPAAHLEREIELIRRNSHLADIYDSVTDIVLILNVQRQIIYANKNCLDFAQVNNEEELFGLRPGDLVKCNYSCHGSGCGTTEFCRKCGTVNAIISAQKGRKDQQECKISQKSPGDALDLLVKTTPLHLEDKLFTVVAMTDISNQKRRRALERIFFHDILNTASGIYGLAALISDTQGEEFEELRTLIAQGSATLIDEIQAQRQLASAESHELQPNPVETSSRDLLIRLEDFYGAHPVAENRFIRIDPGSPNIRFTTDQALLSRVLGNMIKNAFEASGPRNTVTLSCRRDGEDIRFSVHSQSYIPKDTQMQIFKRSFSTKGDDRGIGTYSMKLLSERYLYGEVGFDSSENDGTTFWGLYPIEGN